MLSPGDGAAEVPSPVLQVVVLAMQLRVPWTPIRSSSRHSACTLLPCTLLPCSRLRDVLCVTAQVVRFGLNYAVESRAAIKRAVSNGASQRSEQTQRRHSDSTERASSTSDQRQPAQRSSAAVQTQLSIAAVQRASHWSEPLERASDSFERLRASRETANRVSEPRDPTERARCHCRKRTVGPRLRYNS